MVTIMFFDEPFFPDDVPDIPDRPWDDDEPDDDD